MKPAAGFFILLHYRLNKPVQSVPFMAASTHGRTLTRPTSAQGRPPFSLDLRCGCLLSDPSDPSALTKARTPEIRHLRETGELLAKLLFAKKAILKKIKCLNWRGKFLESRGVLVNVSGVCVFFLTRSIVWTGCKEERWQAEMDLDFKHRWVRNPLILNSQRDLLCSFPALCFYSELCRIHKSKLYLYRPFMQAPMFILCLKYSCVIKPSLPKSPSSSDWTDF